MLIRNHCSPYLSSPLAWELSSYCTSHTSPEHRGISVLFLCSKNMEGGRIDRNSTKTIIMPYLAQCFTILSSNETAIDFTSKGTPSPPQKKNKPTPSVNLFPVQERNHDLLSEGLQETCSPWIAHINSARPKWTNPCYPNISNSLSDPFLLSSFHL